MHVAFSEYTLRTMVICAIGLQEVAETRKKIELKHSEPHRRNSI